MDCSEFLKRFSEFYDAPQTASVRQEAEAHLAECESVLDTKTLCPGVLRSSI
jgi:hypothetical protein